MLFVDHASLHGIIMGLLFFYYRHLSIIIRQDLIPNSPNLYNIAYIPMSKAVYSIHKCLKKQLFLSYLPPLTELTVICATLSHSSVICATLSHSSVICATLSHSSAICAIHFFVVDSEGGMYIVNYKQSVVFICCKKNIKS